MPSLSFYSVKSKSPIFNLEQYDFITCDTLPQTSFTNIFWSQNPENEKYKIFCLLWIEDCDVISGGRRTTSYKLQAGKTNDSNIHSDGRLPDKTPDWEMFFAVRIIASEELRHLSLVHIFPCKVPGRGEIGPSGRLLCFGKTCVGKR